uniref:Uncharacterized protein n=1 Tax=Desulfovibrio sp. U5L TaxID=596152 RepID=I2Q063_9BACT
MSKVATKQCWMCSNYTEKGAFRTQGTCDYAAECARVCGCPVTQDGAKVPADGDATDCDGFDLTTAALREICRCGFSSPWADQDDWDRLTIEDGDRIDDADPNAGIHSPPLDRISIEHMSMGRRTV